MPEQSATPLFDVVKVRIADRVIEQVLDTNKTEPNAQAIVDMAVIRQGVENHIFVYVPAGEVKEGDIFTPSPQPAPSVPLERLEAVIADLERQQRGWHDASTKALSEENKRGATGRANGIGIALASLNDLIAEATR